MVIDFYYSNAKRNMWTKNISKIKRQKYEVKRGKANIIKEKKKCLFACKRETVF